VLAASYGVDTTAKLSLGVSINIWDDNITGDSEYKNTEYTTSQFQFGPAVFPIDPLRERNWYKVDRGVSAVFGALYRFSKQITLGAVIKPPYQLEVERHRLVEQMAAAGKNVNFDYESSAELEFPWVLGLGAAWRPCDNLTVSSDVTWTEWSEYRFAEYGIEVNPLDRTADELQDVATVRLGCEYLLIHDRYVVPLRCGVGYDPMPGVGETYHCFTASAGTGIQLNDRVSIDLAYEYRWGEDVNDHFLRLPGATQDTARHRVLLSMIVYFE